MGPYRETFRHTLPTSATVLTGVLGGHRDHLTPGPCCLGFEDGAERRPARITDALGKVPIPDHIADLQIFQIDYVVGSDEGERRLMVEVGTLAPDRLLLLGKL